MSEHSLAPTNQFANLTEEEFRVAFLAAVNGTNEDANRFFNQFKYRYDLFARNFSAALSQGLDLLARCYAVDEAGFCQIHKGSAYYWLGIAAFFVQDFELATFFFDASVAEDLRAGADPISNPTPSLHFMLIEGEPPNQAARDLVRIVQTKTEELIDDYNRRPGKSAGVAPFSIDDLRQKFLIQAISKGGESWRSSATTLISYCMEWDYRNSLLNIRPIQGTAEPFFLHLFKGCVLFESLLKGNPTKQPQVNSTLGSCLEFLHNELGIAPNLGIGNTDFPSIITNLAGADDSIRTAIRFTGMVRNTLGHNLGWIVSLDKTHYQRLFKMVSSSCFHAIATLY